MRILLCTAAFAAVLLPEAPASSSGPTIRLQGTGAKARFEVHGLTPAELAKSERTQAQWNARFAVYVVGAGQGEPSDRPAMLGSYQVVTGVLSFAPRFALEQGVRYRAVYKGGPKPVVAEFLIPRPAATASTVVQQVYPSPNLLPENQLRFYLQFSAPMSRGDSYQFLHLLDAAGKEIDAPFLELGEELWDPSGRRFTLLFDPGRVKRGLKPREEVGPVLEEGKSYTLVIDRDWCDAAGNPLKESCRKAFRTGPPDDRPLEPEAWKIQAPAAGKVEPLTVGFPKSLDHALLERMLWVTDAEGRRVAGKERIGHEETRWHFTPEKPWQAGAYSLVVDTALEDSAGNAVGRPFEVDVFRPIQRIVKTETVKVPFKVRAPPSPR